MNRRKIASILLFILMQLCFITTAIGPLFAQETTNKEGMTYQEKLKRWQELSEEQKNKIRTIAKSMSEAKFKKLEKNFRKIKTLKPAEQERIRSNYKRMKSFDKKKREQVRKKFKRFKEFSPEKREQFRKRHFNRQNNKNFLDHKSNQGRFNPDDNRRRPGMGNQNGSSEKNGQFRPAFKRLQEKRNQKQNPLRRDNEIKEFRRNSFGGEGQSNENKRPFKNRWKEIRKFREGMGNIEKQKGSDKENMRQRFQNRKRDGDKPDLNQDRQKIRKSLREKFMQNHDADKENVDRKALREKFMQKHKMEKGSDRRNFRIKRKQKTRTP